MASVKSNIVSNIISTALHIMAPVIVIPILTSDLGMGTYGQYVTLTALVALFAVLSDLGLDMYLPKELSVCRNKKQKVSDFIWFYIVVKSVVVVFSVPLLFFLVDSSVPIYIYVALYLTFQIFNPSILLNGLEAYGFLTKVGLITKVILVMLVFTLDFSSYGLEKAILIQCFVLFLTNAALYFYLYTQGVILRPRVKPSFIYKHLRLSFPFYSARLFVNIYQQSSTYLVSLFLSAELVAVYSIGTQLYKVGQATIGAVARVLYTSTVNTKNITLVKKVTVMSVALHLFFMPIVYIYGEYILSLIFDFDLELLLSLSKILYITLIAGIISSYWGYPVLTAINKQNYAHLGILMSALGYYSAIALFYFIDEINVFSFVYCILIAELLGSIARVYFAYIFRTLYEKK